MSSKPPKPSRPPLPPSAASPPQQTAPPPPPHPHSGSQAEADTTAARPPMEIAAAWTRYKKIKAIGAGACGQVFLVETDVALRNGRIPAGRYVIKRIPLINANEELIKSAATEVKIFELLEPHENIVKYYEHFLDDEGHMNLVMEYCAGGSLEEYLTARRQAIDAAERPPSLQPSTTTLHKSASTPISLCEAVFFAFQLFAAVRHLHQNGIIHRDLKPANIFLVPPPPAPSSSSENPPSSSASTSGGAEDCLRVSGRMLTLKVADFGISRVVERTSSMVKTVLGTPFYIAPELCNGEPYDHAADIWSLGCILYEIGCTGENRCFRGDNLLAVVRTITSGIVPPLPNAGSSKYCSSEMHTFLMPMIKPLLQADPKTRFGAEDCLKAFFLPEDEDFEDDFEDPEDDLE